MERIGRPGDEFRERLSRADIERICALHGVLKPATIVPERRGNETVSYHLDEAHFLSFGVTDCTRRKVEVLGILERLEAMPAPRVIAWSEQDAELQAPYMIVERCPGLRLDVLWEECVSSERLPLLEDLGRSMGRYHAIGLAEARTAGREAGAEQWVVDGTEARLQRAATFRRQAPTDVERLCERLHPWRLDGAPLVSLLREHYTGDLPAAEAPFAGPGLSHTEPFAEHFIVDRSGAAFRLSGCVDMEECAIADSFDEIVEMYVTMLVLDGAYWSAFRRGYEQWFAMPADAERRLRAGAVDHDLGNVLWLLDAMERRPEWSFATGWLSGHLRRLEGWLDERRQIGRALFRKDIGPW